MARDLSTDMLNAIVGQDLKPVLFYSAVFAGNSVKLWTGLGDIIWDGSTWNGNGWFTGLQGNQESDDVSAPQVTVELAGIPPAILAFVLNANQGALGEFFLGMMDDNGDLIDEPYKFFSGKLDVPVIKESADGSRVEITYESALVDFDRAREYRYSQESQKIFYPTDKGFEYVVSANKITMFWGNKKKTTRKRERKNKQNKKNTR